MDVDKPPIESMSDAELDKHVTSRLKSRAAASNDNDDIDDNFNTLICNVTIISDDYVAKHHYERDVPDMLQAVAKAEALGLPVPPILQLVRSEANDAQCIQRRIRGSVLNKA